SGGNVSIDPEFVVVRGGSVLASANAGNGGNVAIRAGTFVLDTATTIDASSTLGLDGVIAIDSPHEVTGELLPMAPPVVGVSALVSQRCVPALYAERSSLTVEPIRAAAPNRFVPTPFESVDAGVERIAEPLRASASDAGAATLENCYRGARGD
ncbi:MAG TPA: hypothetical protein VKA43_13265, partial [Gammaproteobacteria bacterium]|nr:hypothetical protein [Gammaproteobacteria bacterium]